MQNCSFPIYNVWLINKAQNALSNGIKSFLMDSDSDLVVEQGNMDQDFEIVKSP